MPLVCQQFFALFYKNLLLSWRSKTATCLQLFSSFFLILIIFAIQESSEVNEATSLAYKNVTDPTALISPAIPPCEDKFYVRFPCFDFVWSGNQSRRVNDIVSAIMDNNPGRRIPNNKVKSFEGADEVDEWFKSNPLQTPIALHFSEKNATIISYGIQTNSSSQQKRGVYEDPLFKFLIPLQIATEREITRSLLGDSEFGYSIGLKEFARPASVEGEIPSVLDTMGPVFFLAFSMFGFVLQLASLVTEKELKLRQAMTMMGVYDSAYWLSWLIWEGLLTALSSLFLVLFGMMFRFEFFLKNSFVVIFLLFLLFQLNMIGFAYAISAFINKSSSATTVGFIVFLIGFITQIVTLIGYPYSSEFSSIHRVTIHRVIWSLFPPNTFTEGLLLLFNATSSSGISWSNKGMCTDCVITMNGVYNWLMGTFVFWFGLALYLDNVVPNISGVRKSIFYFLNPSYWTGNGGNKLEEGSICSCFGSVPSIEQNITEDNDVIEEETLVKQEAVDGIVDPNIAVQIHGLVKTYPGTTKIGCCCKFNKTSPFHAIKGLWMNIAKDQLFCLLGPNGAGKTTTISCLTGITPVTSGDARIYGNSIRSSVGMSNIRTMIGVCPQFDILWDALTSEEHLYLFASIKGLMRASIKPMINKLLADVKLSNAAKIRAGSYSGGMKRRLSVAIALVGHPKLVFLDEPTTGMDPITRRHVWDIIQESKKDRAIVLTTHSMEEADVLSDRIGIMAKGRLRCIGTSIRLKSRFGTGFVATIRFTENRNDPNYKAELLKNFFKQRLNVVATEESKEFITFVIPHDKEKLLTRFFAELQDQESEFGISDIQLGLATLEEVFLNIARQAELESATANGTTVTLELDSGMFVEIPVGARFIGIPGTENTENPRGIMVEVYWQQDGSGSLCISGHSPAISIPPDVPVTYAPPPQVLGRGQKQVRGFVIDYQS